MKQDTDIKIAIEIGTATRVSATEITAFVAMFVAEAESVNDDLWFHWRFGGMKPGNR
jgi:hypothetical protein